MESETELPRRSRARADVAHRAASIESPARYRASRSTTTASRRPTATGRMGSRASCASADSSPANYRGLAKGRAASRIVSIEELDPSHPGIFGLVGDGPRPSNPSVIVIIDGEDGADHDPMRWRRNSGSTPLRPKVGHPAAPSHDHHADLNEVGNAAIVPRPRSTHARRIRKARGRCVETRRSLRTEHGRRLSDDESRQSPPADSAAHRSSMLRDRFVLFFLGPAQAPSAGTAEPRRANAGGRSIGPRGQARPRHHPPYSDALRLLPPRPSGAGLRGRGAAYFRWVFQTRRLRPRSGGGSSANSARARWLRAYAGLAAGTSTPPPRTAMFAARSSARRTPPRPTERSFYLASRGASPAERARGTELLAVAARRRPRYLARPCPLTSPER